MSALEPPVTTSPRSASGRLDLLRALVAGGEAGLEASASLLGYERRTDELPESERGRAQPSQGARRGKPGIPASTPPPKAFRPILFWRSLAAEQEAEAAEKEKAAEEPGDAPELTEDDLRPPPGARPPEPPPLAPWPRLWRTLDDALRTPRHRREIDVETLVRRWARGEPVRRLPRRSGLTHARVALVVDREPRLVPFWHDQVRLIGALARRLGPASLRLLPPPAAGAPAAGAPAPAVTSAGDEVVLALSDLGLYGGPAACSAWMRFGRDLVRGGARLLALVPCPANRWHGPVAGFWSAIDWGSPTGAPRRGEAPSDDELRKRCEKLLQLLSPAVRVEPGLLREMRLLLPEADPGTEADVWSHPLVDASSTVALSLEPVAARRWQRELAELPSGILTGVVDAILRWHLPLTRELQAEEVASLLACGVKEAEIGEARVRATVEIFRRIGTTLHRRSPEASAMAAGVYAYFRRFKDRASEGAWHHDRLRRPLAQAMAALRRHRAEESLPVGVTTEMLRLLAADRKRPRRKWTIRQRGESLIVRPFEQEDAGGSFLALVEGREPLLTVADRLTPAAEVALDREPCEIRLPVTGREVEVRSDLETVRLDADPRPPWAVAAGRDVHGFWASFDVDGVEQRMRWIPPGRFLMGSPKEEVGRSEYEGPQRLVILTRGFWLGETACTQALWQAVMKGENPSRFQTPRRPVEQVSWNDCQEFLDRLNERVLGLEARLPTEEQWEYACRAGTETSTWAGDLEIVGKNNAPVLDEIAWYGGNSGVLDLGHGSDSSSWLEKQYDHDKAATREVGLKRPNPWGFYDMLGNVWEWCDSTGGSVRVFRGGSWNAIARLVRAAARDLGPPGRRSPGLGFRLSRGQGRGAAGGGAAGRARRGTRRRAR